MQVEVQSRRTSPFLLGYRVHQVDSDAGAQDTLLRTLTDKGFGHLIGDRVFLHRRPFEDALPSLLEQNPIILAHSRPL
jgi:hypothetical protein